MTVAPSPAAVSTVGLRKSYGDKTVLDGIDLRIPAGSVFALLGPNGAGKTTAVKILSTLITADGGQAQVAGHDLATATRQAVRAAIGVTGQFSAVDGLITGEENMLLMADLHHLSKREGRRVTAELLERFDLAEAAKKPASTYSGGMKRRLDIAMTLVGNPRIIFLDEPTTGLDPRSRHNMWQIIRELVSDGVTVFLTTQYLEEADELADRIAVLNDGKIAAEGTADELKRLIPGGHVRLRFADPSAYRSAASPARGHLARRLTRGRRGAGAADPQRRQPARTALHPRLAGRGRHRGGRTDRAHPRPRRRLLRPDRHRGRHRHPAEPAQGGRAMSTLSLAVRDSSTMLRRNLLHARRYPSLTLNLLLTPVMLLLLFVYIFGDVMSAGIGGGGADRSEYIAYLVPGILMLTIGGTTIGSAVSVSTDMTEGIIARFRTMAIHRGSVLIGHVVGSVLQCVMSVVLVGAVARGHRLPVHGRHRPGVDSRRSGCSRSSPWRSPGSRSGWAWSSPNAEAASNNALPLMILPLLSSAFVPVDAMPGWFQPIAEYQPFTPAIETLRGLLLGTEIGNNGWLAVVWCLGLAALGYVWSKSLFNRDPK